MTMVETQEPENKGQDNGPEKEKAQEETKQERQPKDVTITDIELERLKQDAVEHKDKYLRGLAESENMKRRLQKEKQDLMQYSIKSIVAEFLNPIDQMEKALSFADQSSDEVKNWAVGFEMILKQFKDVLANNGINAFESLNKTFDPHFHEAVEMVETDEVEAGIVVEEMLKGYQMGDRIVRPARVKVSKKPQEQSESKTDPEEEKLEENNN